MNRIWLFSRRILAATVLALLLALLVAPAAWAFEGRTGNVVTIGADEVVEDDLYVAANDFTLDGTIKGDLVVVGSTIRINGTVEGDLIAAGQSVIINGTVQDDARIAGYALTVAGQVTDDILGAGFSLEDTSASTTGGDLIFGGYQTILAGDVAGHARLSGGAVRLSGSVGKDLAVDVGGTQPNAGMPVNYPFFPGTPSVPTVPMGLTIEGSAHIGGNLDYTANSEVTIPSGAVAGKVNFTQYVAPERGPQAQRRTPSAAAVVGRWFLRQLRALLALLLLGVLAMWLVPGWTRRIAGFVESKPLPSLGWGVVVVAAFIVTMLALVIATILLAVVLGLVTLGELAGRAAVLGGIVTSTTGFVFSVTWAYVTRIVMSLLLGQLIFRLFKSPAEHHRWWPMLLGVLIFVIITAIPILGFLAKLGTVLLGLGAIYLWARDWLKNRRAVPSASAGGAPSAGAPA